MMYPVLLCGGAGTRLWPASRQSFPKQFARLMGGESLFQALARRLSGEGFAAPIVVTGDPFRFIVTEQLAQVSLAADATLIEPEARNTAPAVLAAALWLAQRDPEAVMIVSPADHVIPDGALFRDAVSAGRPEGQGCRSSHGVQPRSPAMGLVRKLRPRKPLPGEAHRREARCGLVAPVASPPRRALDRGGWNRAGSPSARPCNC